MSEQRAESSQQARGSDASGASRPIWDPESIRALLNVPFAKGRPARSAASLLQHPPYGGWIQAHGGLEAVYDYLRARPLNLMHQRMLAFHLAHPGETLAQGMSVLDIPESTYNRRLKELLVTLAVYLNAWPATMPGAPADPAPGRAAPLASSAAVAPPARAPAGAVGAAGAPSSSAAGRRLHAARGRLLRKVWEYWIEGVLELSLYQAVLLELRMETRADLLADPWESLIQQPTRPSRQIAAQTSILDIFDQGDGQLLIVGAPGSGKTTMLLHLARSLLLRAESDPSYPLPVVLNLSSWSAQRLPLEEWIVDELNIRYDIPKGLARQLVGGEQVLPLLDGLDEVEVRQRGPCVSAINGFRLRYGMLPMVVCSRLTDLESLDERLRLERSILLQPLSRRQVDAYLARFDAALAGVQLVLQEDHLLRELVDTPLMLQIVTLTYEHMRPESIRATGSLAERRERLFADYTASMLRRRGTGRPYSPEQMIFWLSWLADRQLRHGVTVFFVEALQRGWLSSRLQRGVYALSVGLTGGLLMGLSLGLVVGVATPSTAGLVTGLVVGLIRGLMLTIGAATTDIRRLERRRWAWRNVRSVLRKNLLARTILGVFAALANLLFVRLAFGDVRNLILPLLAGLGGGLFSGLLFSLTKGWSEIVNEEDLPTALPQGMRRAGLNALRLALYTSLITGCGGVVVGWILASHGIGSATLVPMAAACGLVGGLLDGWLYNGGEMVLRHAVLRRMLRRGGVIPPDYTHFLNTAADHILLRKVGGGYMFVHRLLLEHFARRWRESGGDRSGERGRRPARRSLRWRASVRRLLEVRLPSFERQLDHQDALGGPGRDGYAKLSD